MVRGEVGIAWRYTEEVEDGRKVRLMNFRDVDGRDATGMSGDEWARKKGRLQYVMVVEDWSFYRSLRKWFGVFLVVGI